MIESALRRVTEGERLSRGEMRAVLRAIVESEGREIAVAGLLAALRMRGETAEEIVGAAEAMRELALPLPDAPEGAMDTCGTGGDGSGTFNISTAAALVASACGAPVAKHGNRAASSRCGSADVLEALGVRIDDPLRAAASVREMGIGFLFAPACHPAMSRVAPVRRALGIPTLFNRLGPLTNPMRVRRHLVGVSEASFAEPMLECLARLGAERAWVVHAEDGLDEISPCAATQVWSYHDGKTARLRLEPGELVAKLELEDLRGGDAGRNAAILRGVLRGERGPHRDAVLLNAGAACVVAGLVGDPAAGVERAAKALDSGAAREKLERWIAFMRAGSLQ
jgi:anthranilate phosphoribosyltransferase